MGFLTESDKICIYKWGFSSVYLQNGTTNSCSMCPPLSIPLDNFDTFHNLPVKLQDRQDMLEGKWPTSKSCYSCSIPESAGASSFRLEHKHDIQVIPVENIRNGKIIEVTPRVVEIFFTNLCNLGCVYCSAKFSSVWETELKKGNYANISERPITTYYEGEMQRLNFDKAVYSKYVDKMYSWLEANLHNVHQVGFLGGEPFFQIQEFDRFLMFLQTHGHDKLELSILSNMTVKTHILEKYIGIFKELKSNGHIKDVIIGVSLDSFDETIDYVRYGIDRQLVDTNIRLLLKNEHTVHINSAITLLTLRSYKSLLHKIIEWQEINPFTGVYAEAVTTPTYLNPNVIPIEYYGDTFTEIKELFAQLKHNNRYTKILELDQYISRYTATEKQPELKAYMEELDRVRGLNWRKTFPWLIEILDK